jgi:hypothetical protein
VRDLETLSVADFAPLRGDRFRVTPANADPFDAS